MQITSMLIIIQLLFLLFFKFLCARVEKELYNFYRPLRTKLTG